MSIQKYWIACVAIALGLIHATSGLAATYSDVVMGGNPLLYWNFNEPGDTDNAIDQVGTDVGDNLAPQGNATRTTSTSTTGGLSLGRAASFDGVSPTKFFTSTLSPTTDPDAWAIEMWVRPQGPDPGNRFAYLLESRGSGNNAPGVLFDYGSGTDNNVEIFHAGTRTGAAGPVLADNVWQHLVIGNFGAANDRVDFYLNGASAGSVTYTGDSVFGTTSIAVGSSVPGDYFKGQIDELAVYDLTGLSVSEISSKLATIAGHYSAAVPEPTSAFLIFMAVFALCGWRIRNGSQV